MAIGDVLWSPPPDALETSEVGRFVTWLRDERGRDLPDYDALWRWSVDDLEGFWAAIWDFFGVREHAPYERVLDAARMPGAHWFSGARLNYAEHLLGTDADTDTTAFYVIKKIPSATAMATDASGEGGLVNLKLGSVALTGSLQDGRNLGTVTVVTRPMGITYTSIVPSPN